MSPCAKRNKKDEYSRNAISKNVGSQLMKIYYDKLQVGNDGVKPLYLYKNAKTQNLKMIIIGLTFLGSFHFTLLVFVNAVKGE